jgi:dipeptidase D
LEINTYAGLEPVQLWHHFAALNAIPRPSGQEDAARAYVEQVAQSVGATCDTDAAGNLVVHVAPRNGGSSQAPIVAVQSHLDMVCEKRPDVQHDFSVDAIETRREGDLIYAEGTTLGADNGIGAAAALALLTEPGLRHGPLELIFTVEEETGLHGAMALDPSLLQATMLINLDSEDPDELTIGCAGGAETMLGLPLAREATPANWQVCDVRVSGLKGGHSGVQIHQTLANAIKLLASLLPTFPQQTSFRLVEMVGGSAHNAIPRDATARIVVAPDAIPTLKTSVDEACRQLCLQWADDEPNLNIELQAVEETPASPVLTTSSQEKLLRMLNDLPHGVLAMSDRFSGKVQTSTNLSKVETRGEQAEVATSSRSFVAAELQNVQEQIRSIGAKAGAKVEMRNGYPGWEPDADSQLLQKTRTAYEQVVGKPAQVEVVHAGLECGVILSRKPGMEAISFGPMIRGAHSPEECVAISTVAPTWKLLTTLLADLSQ